MRDSDFYFDECARGRRLSVRRAKIKKRNREAIECPAVKFAKLASGSRSVSQRDIHSPRAYVCVYVREYVRAPASRFERYIIDRWDLRRPATVYIVRKLQALFARRSKRERRKCSQIERWTERERESQGRPVARLRAQLRLDRGNNRQHPLPRIHLAHALGTRCTTRVILGTHEETPLSVRHHFARTCAHFFVSTADEDSRCF